MDLLIASVSILTIAVVLMLLGQRLKIPSIVTYLIIGMLVGPLRPSGSSPISTRSILGDIGIILLLFTIGLEFWLQKLLRS